MDFDFGPEGEQANVEGEEKDLFTHLTFTELALSKVLASTIKTHLDWEHPTQ
ncbi:hypothetical protein KIPB_016432, partial [Kipferlia bialata]|eukprot:g16432.t1